MKDERTASIELDEMFRQQTEPDLTDPLFQEVTYVAIRSLDKFASEDLKNLRAELEKIQSEAEHGITKRILHDCIGAIADEQESRAYAEYDDEYPEPEHDEPPYTDAIDDMDGASEIPMMLEMLETERTELLAKAQSTMSDADIASREGLHFGNGSYCPNCREATLYEFGRVGSGRFTCRNCHWETEI